ncbi:PLP-dependent aminotransferase family protein [Caulobacter sp. BK020]|uniref:aminotransferase-like domain-containing protein n=1 Tax=Caulobacter sp. BK020 TaxID=2512117 RepID=UPI0010469271|nr:PLP-dependent aminotransferase family protein [Caulobacter sp. BK020]TCS12288.1 GntR family transcriptional regulator [Caulobacter sp. BK020]
MAGWTPTLSQGEAPLYERLLDALRRDIASGALSDGDRLPPQRDLAHRLGLGLGTVTRAYVEAEKAGLVQAHVGRGSFVRGALGQGPGPATEDPRPINLSQNIAPVTAGGARIVQTLARLQRRPDLLDNLAYAPSTGLEAHRRAFATWLSRTAGVERADWRQVICCAGAQQALGLALAALCRPGDEVLCEAATFPGARVLADHAGYRLTGVAMDGEGLLPEALDRAAANGAKAVFVLPTLQNPTARIMGIGRRADIVAVARRRDLWIIEDGIYSIFGGDPLPALVELAPERTIHVSGVSKSLSPGLRVGFLLAPLGDLFERVVHAVRAQFYAPPNFGALIASQWIEDGTAEAIAGDIRDEMGRRLGLARAILGPAMEAPASAFSPHVWLPMGELAAERLAGRALRGGVEVTPPGAPIVEPGLESGVRLCLGAARDRAELEQGLQVVASALAGVDERSRAVI